MIFAIVFLYVPIPIKTKWKMFRWIEEMYFAWWYSDRWMYGEKFEKSSCSTFFHANYNCLWKTFRICYFSWWVNCRK